MISSDDVLHKHRSVDEHLRFGNVDLCKCMTSQRYLTLLTIIFSSCSNPMPSCGWHCSLFWADVSAVMFMALSRDIG
jgi:hypothetical protein